MAENKLLEENGRVSNEEADAVLLKMTQKGSGYLYDRLKAILVNRDPAEAEAIRTQYLRMAEELEAEEAARIEEMRDNNKSKSVSSNYDKMLRFLENYSRVQESHNLKKHQTLQALMTAEERIKKQQEEKEYWHVLKVAEIERSR